MNEFRWDWTNIDTSKTKFPNDFIWGVAVSEYQVSGAENCPDSNWAHWERQGKTPPSGSACDSYNRPAEDITCAKALDVNAYRFSVAWDKIEPSAGVYDEKVIAHYQTFCDNLIAAGMQPVVTLHHFVHPLWFEEKGAFEKAENNAHFVRFCITMFEALKNHGVKIWCTINEPGVYVSQGYILGLWPPGKMLNDIQSSMQLAGTVTYNLLQAHNLAYKAIKACEGGAAAQVGIAHSITFLDSDEPSNPDKALIITMLNHYSHNAITQYFKTGIFSWFIPVPDTSVYIDDSAQEHPRLDFIGLQYYTHVMLKLPNDTSLLTYLKVDFKPQEIHTSVAYSLYPEGMYLAIKLLGKLNVPIIITETGVSDADDTIRPEMIRTYLYAISKAIEEGADVRGCFYWSLLDNYEWSEGFAKKFGLYAVDMVSKKRTLRKSAQPYIEIIKRSQDAHKLQ